MPSSLGVGSVAGGGCHTASASWAKGGLGISGAGLCGGSANLRCAIGCPASGAGVFCKAALFDRLNGAGAAGKSAAWAALNRGGGAASSRISLCTCSIRASRPCASRFCTLGFFRPALGRGSSSAKGCCHAFLSASLKGGGSARGCNARERKRGQRCCASRAAACACAWKNLSSAPKEDMSELDLIFITSTSGCGAQRFSPK